MVREDGRPALTVCSKFIHLILLMLFLAAFVITDLIDCILFIHYGQFLLQFYLLFNVLFLFLSVYMCLQGKRKSTWGFDGFLERTSHLQDTLLLFFNNLA